MDAVSQGLGCLLGRQTLNAKDLSLVLKPAVSWWSLGQKTRVEVRSLHLSLVGRPVEARAGPPPASCEETDPHIPCSHSL